MNRKISILSLSFAICQLSFCPVLAQKLSIQNTVVNCGKTGYMLPVTAQFEIKNKGLRHLTISDVKTDCGCTTVELPKKSLGPGEKFTLKLTYDARMLGHFQKQAAIYSNATKEPVYIMMKGVVVTEVLDYSGQYPYQMLDLLADKDQLEFDDVNRGDRPEQVIHILNNSDKVMEPNVMHLPPYLTATVEPKKLQPGRAGKVTFTLHSTKLHGYGLTQSSVYLAGQLGDKVGTDNELPVSVVLLPDMQRFDGKNKQYAPQMHLSADSLTLGLVDGKMHKSETILITNNGRTELDISSIRMFTGGLKLTLGKQKLQPGEQTKLKVTANREQLRKARQKPRILMITNDPDLSKVVIKVNVK